MLLEGVVPFEGKKIKPHKWNEIPFDPKAGGCGASMRAMCIGLKFPRESERENLIAISIESGRMTHNHPVAFFGAFVSALFTAYAIEGVPVVEWGRRMIKELPLAKKYVQKIGRNWDDYVKVDVDYFEKQWLSYLNTRDILDSSSKGAQFPKDFGVKERDAFYKSLSFDGWGGSSGHDSVIIAYDALLGAGENWEEMLKRGALHGGDSDSTGAIGCAWWGALYGFHKVPEKHWSSLEYRKPLEELAQQLLILSGKV